MLRWELQQDTQCGTSFHTVYNTENYWEEMYVVILNNKILK